VTASNKVALRFWDDDNRSHTVSLDQGDGTLTGTYQGPGPLKNSAGTEVCTGAACSCWGDRWSGQPKAEYYVEFQFQGKTKRLSVNSSSKRIKNTATDTGVRVSTWGHYINIYLDTAMPPNNALTTMNQGMGGYALMTGMCGGEGSQLGIDGNRDTRPNTCGDVTAGHRPSFINWSLRSKSLYTKYGETDQFCTSLLRNGAAWKTDTYYGYSGNSYGLSLDEGHISEQQTAAHRPLSFDKAKALEDLKELRRAPAKLAPLAPRSNSILAQAEALTDKYIAHRRHQREAVDQFLLQQDTVASFLNATETLSGSEWGNFSAVQTISPLKEFIDIAKDYDMVMQERGRESIHLLDPEAMAAEALDAPPIEDVDYTNEEEQGQDACNPLVYERARHSCTGLDRALQACIADICLTHQDEFAAISEAIESEAAENAEEVASLNLQLAGLVNRALLQKMSAVLAASGVECPDLVSGEEPWNVAPYDRLVPAWTMEVYNDVTALLAQQEHVVVEATGPVVETDGSADNENATDGSENSRHMSMR